MIIYKNSILIICMKQCRALIPSLLDGTGHFWTFLSNIYHLKINFWTKVFKKIMTWNAYTMVTRHLTKPQSLSGFILYNSSLTTISTYLDSSDSVSSKDLNIFFLKKRKRSYKSGQCWCQQGKKIVNIPEALNQEAFWEKSQLFSWSPLMADTSF